MLHAATKDLVQPDKYSKKKDPPSLQCAWTRPCPPAGSRDRLRVQALDSGLRGPWQPGIPRPGSTQQWAGTSQSPRGPGSAHKPARSNLGTSLTDEWASARLRKPWGLAYPPVGCLTPVPRPLQSCNLPQQDPVYLLAAWHQPWDVAGRGDRVGVEERHISLGG